MLMAAADDPVIGKGNHGSVLPPSWRTLYEPAAGLIGRRYSLYNTPLYNEGLATWP